DKKNNVLFAESECFVLSPDFKLLDESQVLLKVHRHDNMYNFDLKNIVPSGGLTCLFAKALIDESSLWHRRLGHINFKTINKLVRENLVRGLPSKLLNMTILVLLVRRESNTKLLVRPSLMKGIKRESSVARNPQQNRVAKRKNMTLIEAARIGFSPKNRTLAASISVLFFGLKQLVHFGLKQLVLLVMFRIGF
ncbi:ribonuclease H-like domain-containing protein, partial [Tanacetum coccineum]